MLHNRFTGRIKPFRVAISLRRRQITNDIDQNFVRRFESEGGGVADIQFKNFITFFLKAFRFFQNRATNVITDIFEFAGFFNGDMNLDLLAVIATPCRGSQHETMYSHDGEF